MTPGPGTGKRNLLNARGRLCDAIWQKGRRRGKDRDNRR
jgi:hypothetical protein